MKSLFLLAAAFSILSSCEAQRKSPHDTVSNGTVTVTYGRPYKNNRDIFGGLEKMGEVWRLGADEATTITFGKDVKFEGKDVKAGTYTLFAKLGEKEWTMILNAQLGQWGAYSYDKNKAKDVLQVAVPVKKSDNVVEQLTIRFKGDDMIIEWDKTQVVVSIK